MAGIDYDGAFRVSTLRTAGWFWLGSPFIAAIGLVVGACFALLARRKRWLILCVVFAGLVWLIAVTAYAQLPQRRVLSILGINPERIHRFIVRDSFSDGTTSIGIVSGPPETIDGIAAKRSLEFRQQMSLSAMQSVFPNDAIPDYGDVYTNGWFTCFLHPTTHRIYFRHCPMDAIRADSAATDP